MPKILSFPKQNRWRAPSIGLIGAGEELRLVLALDPPIALSRRLHEAQRALQPKSEGLYWLDARELILPVLEIPRARSEATEAVDARMRVVAAEGFRGRLRGVGLGCAAEGDPRVWARLEDPEGLWRKLGERLSVLLQKDGFEVTLPAAPQIALAEAKQEEPTPLDLGGWATQDLGPFHVWDLVLYQRRPGVNEPIYSAISFASLGG